MSRLAEDARVSRRRDDIADVRREMLYDVATPDALRCLDSPNTHAYLDDATTSHEDMRFFSVRGDVGPIDPWPLSLE
jgi:hypothetical protein